MYYYIYQITNLVNNKIYVGAHKTRCLDDGYMGSGKVIKYAIEKHGLKNFRKDILEFFTNDEDMYAREKEIVTEEFLLREDVYNLRRGGHGGFDYLNSAEGIFNRRHTFKIWSDSGTKAFIEKFNSDEAFKKAHLIKLQEVRKKAIIKISEKYPKGVQYGKKQSEETKLKQKDTYENIGHQQGEKNSQYGKMWIYNLETFESIRINKDEIIPDGWNKGRKIKK